MLTRLHVYFLSVFLLFPILGLHADPSDPAAQSSVLPSPSESGIPEKISKKEVRKIRREFSELLDQERDKLRVEQSRKRKEGEANRKLRKRDWDSAEKASRRKFFEMNTHGPERRQYVKDFNDRRKGFYSLLKNEERQERSELDVRWKALKEAQKTRLNGVEEYLRRSERPPTHFLERSE